MSLFKNDLPEHQIRQQLRFWIVGVFMFLFGIFVGNMVVNALDIQTNISNAVQTIRQIFITSDGRQPTAANTLIVFNSDGSGGVKFSPNSFGGGCVGGGLLALNESGVLSCALNGIGTSSSELSIGSGDVVISSGGIVLGSGNNLKFLDLANLDPSAVFSLDASGNLILLTGLNSPAYFNINRQTSRQGLPAVNVGEQLGNNSTGTTVADFIEGYFFPETIGNVGISNCPGTLEKIGTIQSYTPAAINAVVTKGSNAIAGIQVNNNGTVSNIVPTNAATQNIAISSPNITKNVNASISVEITDVKGRKSKNTCNVVWGVKMFWGKSTKTLAQLLLDSTSVLGLGGSNWASNTLSQTFNGDGFMYIVIPQASQQPTKFTTNGLAQTKISTGSMNLVNANGYSENYIVYQIGDFSPDSISVSMNP